MRRRSPPTLYPYTTLFRSVLNNEAQNSHFYLSAVCELPLFANDRKLGLLSQAEITLCLQQLEAFADALEHALFDGQQDLRSEEHTSELQSRGQLVCRLLLE